MAKSKFASGAVAAEQASKSVGFARTHYFGLEDGHSAYVRFVTDMNEVPGADFVPTIVTVNLHQGVPTRPRPDWLKEDARWYERMGCTCRLTKLEAMPGEPPLWTIMDDKDEFEGCWVCSNLRDKSGKPYRATPRTWGLGCIREEVRENGVLLGYRDKTREVEDKDGNKTVERDVQVFKMGWKNFWSAFDGFANHYGTILDRDYKITRKGSGTSTDYAIVPLDPIPDIERDADGNAIKDEQGNSKPLIVNGQIAYVDLRNKATFDRYDLGIDLDEIVMDQARVATQRRFFDPTYTPPKKDDEDKGGSQASGAPAAQQDKPASDVSEEALAAMAARVTGYGAPAEAQPQAEAPAAPAQPVAPAGLRNIE